MRLGAEPAGPDQDEEEVDARRGGRAGAKLEIDVQNDAFITNLFGVRSIWLIISGFAIVRTENF